MTAVEDFIGAPSEELLAGLTKDQLLRLADHYNVEVSDKRLKDSVRSILSAALGVAGILPPSASGSGAVAAGGSTVPGGPLTFDQQKELLQLQLELARERRLSGRGWGGDGASEVAMGRSFVGRDGFDIVGNLRLLPKFSERDPETFFSLFERVAEARDWPDSERTLMLQCVLTGKAQEAYSALSRAQSGDYRVVKSAVLRAYELVPEAYRQRFRTWRMTEGQTHVEFARELTAHFFRWCGASGVDTFEGLGNLLVLEQFRESVPVRIATYVSEHKVGTVAEAAVLADDYVLIHRRNFVEPRARSDVGRGGVFESARGGGNTDRGVRPGGGGSDCHYCQEPGHWKNECPVLRGRGRGPSNIRPAALAAPGPPHFEDVQGPGSWLPG